MGIESAVLNGAQRLLDSAHGEPFVAFLLLSLGCGFSIVGVGVVTYATFAACSMLFARSVGQQGEVGPDDEFVEDPAEGPGGPTRKKKKARVSTDDAPSESDSESETGDP